MAAYGQIPAFNPPGSKLSVDEVKIKRDQPLPIDSVQIIKDAIELAKAKPTEAIAYPIIFMMVFGFVYTMFSVVLQVVMLPISVIAGPLAEIDETFAMIVTAGLFFVVVGIGMIIQIGLSTIFNLAMYMFFLKIVRGQEVKIEDLKDLKPFIIPAILTMFLFSLATMGGFFLLVIPAYIFMLGFFYAPVLVIDKNLSPMNAMKGSWRLTDGNKVNILIYFLLAGLMNLAGMLACGVGMMLTFPITWIGMMMLYDKLAEPGNAYTGPTGGVAQVFS